MRKVAGEGKMRGEGKLWSCDVTAQIDQRCARVIF